MSDELANQTAFTQDPHTLGEQPRVDVGSSSVAAPKKSPLLLIIMLTIVIVLVAGVGAYIVSNRGPRQAVVVTATPAPTEEPIETAGIRGEIAPYFTIIEQANPENDERPFPPVDFTVRIKDPNQSR